MDYSDLSREFQEKGEQSRQIRDRYLVKYYDLRSNGRYIFIDDKSFCAFKLQKELAVDTIYQATDGKIYYVEEKIDSKPRPNFALETDSCTTPGHEKEGWMHYAKSNLLLYGFVLEDERGVDLYELQFQALKRWFWNGGKDKYNNPYEGTGPYTMHNTYNKTRIWRTPITAVLEAPGVFPRRYLITDDGIEEIPLRTNRIDLKRWKEKLYEKAMLMSLTGIWSARQAQYEEDPWLEEEDR